MLKIKKILLIIWLSFYFANLGISQLLPDTEIVFQNYELWFDSEEADNNVLESKKANTSVKISSEGIYTYLQVSTTVLGTGMYLSSVSTVQEFEIEEGEVVYEVQSISLGSDKEVQYWILLYDKFDNLIQIHKKCIYKDKIMYMTFQ